jgi:hypothetical protein
MMAGSRQSAWARHRAATDTLEHVPRVALRNATDAPDRPLASDPARLTDHPGGVTTERTDQATRRNGCVRSRVGGRH